ncbi:hypothetical protein D3C83_158790 [compost metagenome]
MRGHVRLAHLAAFVAHRHRQIGYRQIVVKYREVLRILIARKDAQRIVIMLDRVRQPTGSALGQRLRDKAEIEFGLGGFFL